LQNYVYVHVYFFTIHNLEGFWKPKEDIISLVMIMH